MDDPLVNELRRRRGTRSYDAFAAELGVSPRMVRAVFAGETRAGHRFLRSVMAYDAALEPLVLDYLRGTGEPVAA